MQLFGFDDLLAAANNAKTNNNVAPINANTDGNIEEVNTNGTDANEVHANNNNADANKVDTNTNNTEANTSIAKTNSPSDASVSPVVDAMIGAAKTLRDWIAAALQRLFDCCAQLVTPTTAPAPASLPTTAPAASTASSANFAPATVTVFKPLAAPSFFAALKSVPLVHKLLLFPLFAIATPFAQGILRRRSTHLQARGAAQRICDVAAKRRRHSSAQEPVDYKSLGLTALPHCVTIRLGTMMHFADRAMHSLIRTKTKRETPSSVRATTPCSARMRSCLPPC